MAAPTIVQPTLGNPLAASCTNYATTVNCAYPVNVTAGNEAYVYVYSANTGSPGTPSCSSGTATIGTFTAVGSGSAAGGAQQWYRAAITGSGSCTISVTNPNGTNNLAVFPFEVANDGGVDTGTNPVYTSGSCFSTTCNNVSITTSTANDLLLYAVTGGTNNTYSALTPYSASGNSTGSSGNEFSWMTGNYTAASAGAVGGTFTTSATVIYGNSVIAIAPSGFQPDEDFWVAPPPAPVDSIISIF